MFHNKANQVVIILCLLFYSSSIFAQEDLPPNILLIISDDIGVDMTSGYHEHNRLPQTPTLDSLRSTGITFENVFAAPLCSPTRAAILTGKYGVKTGVLGVPGNLSLEHKSLFKNMEEMGSDNYADALIGKWHLSTEPFDPLDHGADYFMGVLIGAVSDYYAWKRTENGVSEIDSSYVTSTFTDEAIEWVKEQDKPWFLWLAHVAGHTPLHVPPEHMFSVSDPTNNTRMYLAMVEAMDYEINRLLNALSESERENTLIIYVGDNGTPGNLTQDYPDGSAKGSLYQGGVRVPMIVAGKGVERKGQREKALVHVADIHATILEASGINLEGGLHNSLSFYPALQGKEWQTRDYNYSEIDSDDKTGWTIRNNQYKLLSFKNGSQEFYDLIIDSLEVNDLLKSGLSSELLLIKADLEKEAEQIRTAWSCRDHIQNGDEQGIDCGGSYCEPCIVNTRDENQMEQFTIYPNPSNALIRIDGKDRKFNKVELRDIFGKIILEREFPSTIYKNLDLTDIIAGAYYLEIHGNERNEIHKLLLTE